MAVPVILTYRSEPRVMPDKGSSSSGKCTPPETPYPVVLDPLAKYGGPSRALRLEGRLQRVDGGQNHAERGSALHQQVST